MARLLPKFLTVDLRALAIFRIGLGMILICDIFNRAQDLTAHYTNKGLLPIGALTSEFYQTYHFSLNFINDTAFFQGLLFFLYLCTSFCFLIGYRSKLSSVLCWILLVSVQNRNPMVLQGGDDLLRLILFWSLFLPLGAVGSIDAAMRENRCEEKEICNPASFAILLQVAILYLMTSLLKSHPDWWPNFTASLNALYIEQFTTHLGVFIRQFEDLIKFSSMLVYLLEISAFFLLLSPFWFLRLFGLIALMGMHISFGLSMALGLFPFIDIAALVIFIPRQVWDYLDSKVTDKQSNTIIYYDRDCGFCKKIVKIICQLLFIPNVQTSEAQADIQANKLMEDNNSWVIRSESGKYYQEYSGFIALIEISPYFRFISWLLKCSLFMWLGNICYRQVAKNRSLFGKISAALFHKTVAARLNPGKLSSTIILFLTALCVIWNLSNLPKLSINFPYSLTPIMDTLRINQYWNMFSPKPLDTSGWYVIPGTLIDKTEVNVWTMEESKATFDKPNLVSDTFINQRWRKYLMNIWLKRNNQYRLYFGKYLCKRWNNRDIEHSKKINTFEIYFIKQKINSNSRLSPPEPVKIWSHHCF